MCTLWYFQTKNHYIKLSSSREIPFPTHAQQHIRNTHLSRHVDVDPQIAHDLEQPLVDGDVALPPALLLLLLLPLLFLLGHLCLHPAVPLDAGDGEAALGVSDEHLADEGLAVWKKCSRALIIGNLFEEFNVIDYWLYYIIH